MNSHTITNCQSCGSSKLKPRFFAGYIPSVNVMQKSTEGLREQEFYPAQLLECGECSLVQMGCVVDQSILFPPDYPYTSGTTKALRDNFAELAKEASTYLEERDFVCDIGSNDGTLLDSFSVLGQHYLLLGIEPTDNAKIARAKGIETWQLFFRRGVAKSIVGMYGKKSSLITCCNCFAHMPDIHGVLKGITLLLADDGVFVCEVQYLPRTLAGMNWDCFYHEHIFYYSLTSLSHLLNEHGLSIIDAKEIPTHGGSIRVWAKREGTMSKRAMDLMLAEKESLSDKKWQSFQWKVEESRKQMQLKIAEFIGEFYGIGAPSRSTVLIHYLGLDETVLQKVCEVSSSKKIGHYVPGTAIPIVDEECLYRDQPEYALLLSWHIADELIPKIREKGYSGKFLIPLPEPRIVR